MRISIELIDLLRSKALRDSFNADALNAGVDFRVVCLSDNDLEAFDLEHSQGLHCPAFSES